MDVRARVFSTCILHDRAGVDPDLVGELLSTATTWRRAISSLTLTKEGLSGTRWCGESPFHSFNTNLLILMMASAALALQLPEAGIDLRVV